MDAIIKPDPDDLIDAIIYYKQGEVCEDCINIYGESNSYSNCKCEKCEDCEFRRCLCDLGITISSYEDMIDEDHLKNLDLVESKLQKKAIKLAKETLSKNDLIKLEKLILKNYRIKIKLIS